MVPISAFVATQVRVMLCPETSVVGEAVNEAVGAGPGLGPVLLDPPQLASTKVKANNTSADFALESSAWLTRFRNVVKFPIPSSTVLLF
jgi:hypothetical protein